MHTPELSVVLLSYNRVDLTQRRGETDPWHDDRYRLRLLVVDNASTDGTREYLHTLTDPRTRLLQQDENRWFGGGSNAGLDECRGRYVLLTQNDMTFAPDSFSTLLSMGRTLPNAGCIGIGGRPLSTTPAGFSRSATGGKTRCGSSTTCRSISTRGAACSSNAHLRTPTISGSTSATACTGRTSTSLIR